MLNNKSTKAALQQVAVTNGRHLVNQQKRGKEEGKYF
jgi:hypothetical protein